MIKTAHIVLGAPDPDALFPTPKETDVIIGVDGGAVECYKRGIPIDLALGDFDSITLEEKKQLAVYTDRLEEFKADKDDTDAELAISRAWETFNPEQMILYNWMGGRVDHLLSLLFFAYQPRFESILEKLIFKNKQNTLSFLKPGQHRIQKEEDKTYMSVIGMTPVTNLTLSGMKYLLSEATYTYPMALVSNEILTHDAQLSFEKGILAVIQSGD
ncbi:thiamine diphosphokinase [Alkalibacterium sp. MB6]|uniref:thiamine diphosphokinase n=1 Tax=Alkalibacterium sp. MB6 TaxID=2081965 RepID=UPI00137953BB|nr:thiamine diphosphokinase [Alkalibacterium sp. MB6]